MSDSILLSTRGGLLQAPQWCLGCLGTSLVPHECACPIQAAGSVPSIRFSRLKSVDYSSSTSAEARSDWKAFPRWCLGSPKRAHPGRERRGVTRAPRLRRAQGWWCLGPWSLDCGIPGPLLTVGKGLQCCVQLTKGDWVFGSKWIGESWMVTGSLGANCNRR